LRFLSDDRSKQSARKQMAIFYCISEGTTENRISLF
jgi:hypothetical protein